LLALSRITVVCSHTGLFWRLAARGLLHLRAFPVKPAHRERSIFLPWRTFRAVIARGRVLLLTKRGLHMPAPAPHVREPAGPHAIMPVARGSSSQNRGSHALTLWGGAPTLFVRMPVMVAVGVIMSVIVVMIMMVMAVTAAAAMAMLMLVVMSMVGMSVMMPMMMVMPVVMSAAVVRHGPVGAERALHRRHRAAEAADGFRQRAVWQDIKRVRIRLGQDMGPAGQQGGAKQPRRVFRPHLQHALGGGPHQRQAAVLQLQGVAVMELRGAAQRQIDEQTAVAPQRSSFPRLQVAGAMIERDGVDDAVGLDGGAAGDGGGAWHDGS